jgi:hypothetical protein
LYHLLGGKAAGYTPMRMRWHNDTHWFLRHSSGLILDPTVSQFGELRPTAEHYAKARGCGFLTKRPSHRAAQAMHDMVWQMSAGHTRVGTRP